MKVKRFGAALNVAIGGGLVALVFSIVSCGYEQYKTERKYVHHEGFGSVQAIINKACYGCHNGVKHPLDLSKEVNFNQPKVKAKITSKAMPPNPNAISETDRATLLKYYE